MKISEVEGSIEIIVTNQRNEDRCDRCGRFVTIQNAALYTLYGVPHPNAEDVAICSKCSAELEADQAAAFGWLNKRFAVTD